MNEYQSFLGSAAAGAADAMVEAGGHAPAKAKRRASSERRADRRNRSRSPDRDGAPDVRAEVAERAIEAPTYVEPGAEGDALGVEGRHRNNMGKLFGYLGHLAKLVNKKTVGTKSCARVSEPGIFVFRNMFRKL